MFISVASHNPLFPAISYNLGNDSSLSMHEFDRYILMCYDQEVPCQYSLLASRALGTTGIL